ncbi:MAG: hypothetical protein P1U77_17340 [Rubripirellula sp.]|jgi:hypothetical protein|nr:hypothetical protein [Rubripirellula sp.]
MAGTTFSFPIERLHGLNSSAINFLFAFARSLLIWTIAVGLVFEAGILIETANWAVVPGLGVANRDVIQN